MIEPRIPDTDDAQEWANWLTDASDTGYIDVTIPGGSVSYLRDALEDPAARRTAETAFELILAMRIGAES